jgi:hypothetical protein
MKGQELLFRTLEMLTKPLKKKNTPPELPDLEKQDKTKNIMGVVDYTYNTSTWETEEGG